jgi:hypothetical protein
MEILMQNNFRGFLASQKTYAIGEEKSSLRIVDTLDNERVV